VRLRAIEAQRLHESQGLPGAAPPEIMAVAGQRAGPSYALPGQAAPTEPRATKQHGVRIESANHPKTGQNSTGVDKAASQTLLQSECCSRPCRRDRTRSWLPQGPTTCQIAAEVDATAFAISVRREGGLLIAEAERDDPSTGFLIFRDARLPAPVAGCRPRSFERELSKRPICHSRGRAYRIE
jgi:hypothetical protein